MEKFSDMVVGLAVALAFVGGIVMIAGAIHKQGEWALGGAAVLAVGFGLRAACSRF